MARLIHLNGPPGVGKSAVATQLARVRPLALNLDIDDLRVQLGGWVDNEESKRVARGLGFRLAEWHLADGFDVVLPQLLLRLDVVQGLAQLAQRAGASFHEIVLTAPAETCVQRVARARAEGPTEHPRFVFKTEDLSARIIYCCEAMAQMAESLPGAVEVATLGTVEETAQKVEALLGRG